MAGNIEAAKNICGDCNLFRVKDTAGKLLEKVLIKGEKVDEGFCGAQFGLLKGRLNAKVGCRQPPGVFKPKEANSTAINR